MEYMATVAVMPEVKIKDAYKKAVKKINEKYKDKKAEANDEETNWNWKNWPKPGKISDC